MMFSRSFVVALVSAPFVVLAQTSSGNPNAPKVPDGGYQVTAGKPFTLEWNPTTEGTVTLVLRDGSANNLNVGQVIASGITNSGTYTWDVPSSETRGSDYTIEIVSDSDPTQTNYTPYFVLESTNTVPQSLTSVSLGAPSTSLTLSTASNTATPTSTGTHSGSSTGSAASTTGTETASSTGTHSGSSSMTTSARTSAQQSGLVASATPTTGGAARATAMVGMLGAVALGALAL